MSQINQLSSADTIQLGDLFVLFSSNNGDSRKTAASVLLNFVKQNLGAVDFVTQREVVAAPGFNVQVADNGNNIWLLLQPTTALASGAITLPALSNAIDGQEIMVFCLRQITTFTVNGNGAVAVYGAPSALGAESNFTLRFDAGSNSWYRTA